MHHEDVTENKKVIVLYGKLSTTQATSNRNSIKANTCNLKHKTINYGLLHACYMLNVYEHLDSSGECFCHALNIFNGCTFFQCSKLTIIDTFMITAQQPLQFFIRDLYKGTNYIGTIACSPCMAWDEYPNGRQRLAFFNTRAIINSSGINKLQVYVSEGPWDDLTDALSTGITNARTIVDLAATFIHHKNIATVITLIPLDEIYVTQEPQSFQELE